MYKKICIYSFKINRVFGFSFAFKILKVIAILKWKHAKNPLLIPLGPFGGGGDCNQGRKGYKRACLRLKRIVVKCGN